MLAHMAKEHPSLGLITGFGSQQLGSHTLHAESYTRPVSYVFVCVQIGQRHFNAHAFVNVAIFLDLQETGSNGHKGLEVQDAHVVIGFDQQKGSLSVSMHCGMRGQL